MGPTTHKDNVLMSAKKTAFSDVKNLMGTNTPGGAPAKSGLKKPVFGSQFKASNLIKAVPSESKGAAPSRAMQSRNFKPRINLSAIDYSDNEPHLACKPSGQRDIMYDFWSAASNHFEVYKDVEPVQKKVDLPEMPFISDPFPAPTHSHLDKMPNLFDDIPQLSFSTISSFDDL